MEIRPTIALLGKYAESTLLERDFVREAAVHVLRRDLNCNVLEISGYYEEAEVRKLQEIYRQDLLVLVGIPGQQYKEASPLHPEDLNDTRRNFGGQIPIIIFNTIPRYDEPVITLEPNLYSASLASSQLRELIGSLKTTNQGVVTAKRRQAEPEVQALLQAYDANYPDEDLTYVGDANTKIVAQYLRCRLTPSSLLFEEFDSKLLKDVIQSASEPEKYDYEVSRLRAMTDQEREDTMESIFKSQGMEKTSWGTWFQSSISRGRFSHPFAIDLQTGADIVISGFGAHAYARKLMLDHLKEIEAIRQGTSKFYMEIERGEDEIVTGFVNEYVEGFDTPLLQLFVRGISEIDARSIGKSILSKRQYIPIDNSGQLIDQSYSAPKNKSYDDE